MEVNPVGLAYVQVRRDNLGKSDQRTVTDIMTYIIMRTIRNAGQYPTFLDQTVGSFR